MPKQVKIIECPRDAMQGIAAWIPTAEKVRYIQSILEVGFDTVDFGSFVSPKAIPQLRDTGEVLDCLDLTVSNSKLLAIVANLRGALDACEYPQIRYLGYPFSISETFQMRNTNSTISISLERVEELQDLCLRYNKRLVVYISMAFGNPYGDEWNTEIVQQWVDKMHRMGISILSMSDTIAAASPESIDYIFSHIIPTYPEIEFGAHLHTRADNWRPNVSAAFNAGCRRFDGALRGYGGCPMAKDELTGNLPTEKLITYCREKDIPLNIDREKLEESLRLAREILH